MHSAACLLSLVLLVALTSCRESESNKVATRAALRAAELQQRNPAKKGLYHCWQSSAEGDLTGPDLFLLSDNLYQFGDSPGHYQFQKKDSTIEWLSGPLQNLGKALQTNYRSKGSPTPGGGHTLETMISVKEVFADAKARSVLQCNCADRN